MQNSNRLLACSFFRKCYFNSTPLHELNSFSLAESIIYRKVNWENLHLRTLGARHSIRARKIFYSCWPFFFPERSARERKVFDIFNIIFLYIFNWKIVLSTFPFPSRSKLFHNAIEFFFMRQLLGVNCPLDRSRVSAENKLYAEQCLIVAHAFSPNSEKKNTNHMFSRLVH